ncbi:MULTISPECIES: heavy-metal-associated domain-containing protein [Bacillaceae]|uniref:Copper chaperone CopZ n=2 Tax=Bacillus infantis TaxID=324767 RepID=U5LB76_9BACI|nr:MULTISPECIES: cation transporter [Bacillus]AGX05109.1 copper chaperone CopZ [Bacillus infantis NRRL B-14911]MCA1036978.1 cation transporter [Bacillus infantis]MCK6204806.1 cation transporter [Bacillus infantis]MDT0160553.1 cation transporter [Bacillus sp. AG4(2022)]MDW2875227.1 cation transporter [Bacillus infantis]
MNRTTMTVPEMTCDHCEESIKNALLSLDGVAGVSIALQGKTVEVDYNPEQTSESLIKEAIENEGYGIA